MEWDRLSEMPNQPTELGHWDRGWWVDETVEPDPPVEHRQTIPANLDTWEPGMFMAAVLSNIDRSALTGEDLVTVLRAEERLISHLQAGRYQSMTRVVELIGDQDTAASEVGAALSLTRSAADAEVDLALLLRRFPRVLASLEAGDIDLRRARVLVEEVRSMDESKAGDVLDRVLPQAAKLTTGQLRARVQRLRMEADSKAAQVAYLEGLQRRRVVVDANPDGTANLHLLNLAPEGVMAIRRRISRMARRARTPGDIRTHDQIRADVACDLLQGRAGHGDAPSGGVDIVVDLKTLLGLDENPGHIPGWGPVTAEIARQVVAEQTASQWQFTATDQGRPLATGTVKRRPNTSMTRRIRALHPTCVFPGCRMPAIESDIDHTKPRSDRGPTTLVNLAPLCRHHHRLKGSHWAYEITPEQDIVWTSPLGRTYVTCGQSP